MNTSPSVTDVNTTRMISVHPSFDIKSAEDLIKEAEGEILDPRHSYDMVIPGEIRNRRDISKDEQWLYALLRNLCRREGYCWAQDQYLAQEAQVGLRTVKRYIKNLERSGVIRREVVQFGIKKRRRIFLSMELKYFIQGPNVSPTKGQTCPQRRATDGPYTEERYTNKKKIHKKEPPPTPQGDLSFGKFTHMKKEEYASLIETMGKERVDRILEQINDYLSSTGKKGYKDYAAAVRCWYRRQHDHKPTLNAPESKISENMSIGRSLESNFNIGLLNAKFVHLQNGLELSFLANCPSKVFSYSDPQFREKMSYQLERMGRKDIWEKINPTEKIGMS